MAANLFVVESRLQPFLVDPTGLTLYHYAFAGQGACATLLWKSLGKPCPIIACFLSSEWVGWGWFTKRRTSVWDGMLP